jgi:hypothetical protein
MRERRKARYFAQLSAQYRKEPKALPEAEPLPVDDEDGARQMVTVAELVARIEGEGLPTRLRWEEDGREGRPGEDEWPTGVLRRFGNEG